MTDARVSQTVSPVKREGIWKPLLLVGALCVLSYFPLFNWIEHRRGYKGPWTVDFAIAGGHPVLLISQPALGITNVQIAFPGVTTDTNSQRIEFSIARPVPYPVPFGQCVFQDTTFLPGTIVLEISGHEIQFMPRVLTIDKVERGWRNGETIEVR